MELRYMGFDQHVNTRTYKFDGVEKGQSIVRFLVTADLPLFLKHDVNIQKGPDLCARKLTADPTGLGHHQLTDEDLLTFATARAVEQTRKAELLRKANNRRFHPQPGS